MIAWPMIQGHKLADSMSCWFVTGDFPPQMKIDSAAIWANTSPKKSTKFIATDLTWWKSLRGGVNRSPYCPTKWSTRLIKIHQTIKPAIKEKIITPRSTWPLNNKPLSSISISLSLTFFRSPLKLSRIISYSSQTINLQRSYLALQALGKHIRTAPSMLGYFLSCYYIYTFMSSILLQPRN